MLHQFISDFELLQAKNWIGWNYNSKHLTNSNVSSSSAKRSGILNYSRLARESPVFISTQLTGKVVETQW